MPLENRNANAYILAFDNTGGTFTGVAVNAVSTGPVNVPVVVRDDAEQSDRDRYDPFGRERALCLHAGNRQIPGDSHDPRHH